MERKAIFGIVVKRAKEWNALNVIPVKVRDKDVRADGSSQELAGQCFPQAAKAGAAVENVQTAIDPHFHARGVAAVAHVFALGGGGGSSHSPEFNVHALLAPPPLAIAGAHGDGGNPGLLLSRSIYRRLQNPG